MTKYQMLEGLEAPRTCSGCDRTISIDHWEEMKLIGYQVMPPFDDDPGEVLELRNHECGSTLALLLPFTAQALDDELLKTYGGKRDKETRARAIESLKQRAKP